MSTLRSIFFVLIATLVIMSGSIIGVQAQDIGNDDAETIERPIESQSWAIVFDAQDILDGDPELMQQLADAGYTKEEIAMMQEYVLKQSTVDPAVFEGSVVSRAIDTFSVPCSSGKTANIVAQIGAGFTFLTHTFADGLTTHTGNQNCSLVCVFAAGAQRNNVATSYFTSVNSSYTHKLHSWCS